LARVDVPVNDRTTGPDFQYSEGSESWLDPHSARIAGHPMPPPYESLGPGVKARPETAALLHRVDAVVFDIDGVLVDVEKSYPLVITETVRFVLGDLHGLIGSGQESPLKRDEVPLFKQAGGFNSDWDIARAALRFFVSRIGNRRRMPLSELRELKPSLGEFTASLRGGGLEEVRERLPLNPEQETMCDETLVQKVCEEFYGGDDWCESMFGFRPTLVKGRPGLFNDERSLIEPALLKGRIEKFGIYSTRILSEALPALRHIGLGPALGTLIPDAALITETSGYRKPDPNGLFAAGRALGAGFVVFAGDNVDDLRVVQNARRLPDPPLQSLFAGILGGALGDRAEEIFAHGEADLLATDVSSLMRVLQADRWSAGGR